MQYFNRADKVAVDLGQFVCWNPQFLVHAAANSLDSIALDEFRVDVETRDIPCPIKLHVPITSNLDRVGFMEHWVKEGLFW